MEEVFLFKNWFLNALGLIHGGAYHAYRNFTVCAVFVLKETRLTQINPTYPTGDKHTISTLLIEPIFSVLAHAEKQFFSKLVSK